MVLLSLVTLVVKYLCSVCTMPKPPIYLHWRFECDSECLRERISQVVKSSRVASSTGLSITTNAVLITVTGAVYIRLPSDARIGRY